jgi:hypothetical protein
MSSLGSDREEARAATGDWVGFCGSKRQQSTCGEGVEHAQAVGEFGVAQAALTIEAAKKRQRRKTESTEAGAPRSQRARAAAVRFLLLETERPINA